MADHEQLVVFHASWNEPENRIVTETLAKLAGVYKQYKFVSVPVELVDDVERQEILNVQLESFERSKILLSQYDVTELPFVVVTPGSENLPPSLLAFIAKPAAPTSEKEISEEEASQLRQEALAFHDCGRVTDAAKIYSRLLHSNPHDLKAHFNLGVMLHTCGLSRLAVKHLCLVIQSSPDDAVAHTVLKSVLYEQEPALVLAGYEKIVKDHPENLRASHALAALKGVATHSNAEYVRQVFDDLAETFEDKLVNHLEYKIPWQLLEAVKHVSGAATATWRVLDLGCGTGLCGKLFQPFASHIIGVDLSPLMIEKSRQQQVYDDLRVQDIMETLCSIECESLDLIISADVWIYVGQLDDVFRESHRRLRPGGLFAFSIEVLEVEGDKPFVLAPSGRFKHRESYISALATTFGYTIRSETPVDVRKESNEAIPGRVYVLQV